MVEDTRDERHQRVDGSSGRVSADVRPGQNRMTPALQWAAIAGGLLMLAILSGCLETAPGTITIRNDSDQTIVLQNITDSGAKMFQSTVSPRTTQTSLGSPSKGLCYNRWEIVDGSGNPLRRIDTVCEGDAVTFP